MISFVLRFELLSRIESNPDRWFRRDRIQLEVESTEMLAKFVGSESVQDLVFVDCTTTGVNVILKSLKLSPGITHQRHLHYYMDRNELWGGRITEGQLFRSHL